MRYSPQQVQEAFKKLPFPVRSFVASPDLTDIVEELGTKYGIHVDMLGIINSALTEMLVGLINPAQFSAELKSAGIPESQVTLLVNDLNEKIFKPLHDKFQEEDTESAEIEAERERRRRESAKQAVAPAPSYAPTAPPVSPSPVQISTPPPATPSAPVMATPTPVATTPPPTPQPQVPQAYTPPAPPAPEPAPLYTPPAPPASEVPAQPTMRTMVSDVEQMKQGQTPVAHTYTPSSPLASQPKQESRVVWEPTNPMQPIASPVVTPTAAIERPQIPVPPIAPRTVTPSAQELTHTLKKYGVDPYREPPE